MSTNTLVTTPSVQDNPKNAERSAEVASFNSSNYRSYWTRYNGSGSQSTVERIGVSDAVTNDNG
jgi:hypothetical protein